MLYKDYVERKTANAIRVNSAEGYPCVFDNSKGRPLKDYKIYGNSTQDGTPTLDNPVEIQSVGDLVTDETSEYYGKYDIPITVRGKNLFNINDYRNKQNVSIVGNKITISNMNYVSVANPSILKFLKPNTKYTISAKQWSLDSGTTSNTTFRVAVLNNAGSKLHYFTYGGNATKATPSDISGYTHMAIYSAKDGVISIEDLQIEEDSSITEYEPYHEPITTHIYLNEPLRKVGDYADYIDFKNKKVVRNVVQGVLDGSESLGTNLVPTEEDISLPSLKTLQGTNIISVATEIEPSYIEVKYIAK